MGSISKQKTIKNPTAEMKPDKEPFFKIIDAGDHLNAKTKEGYWQFFTQKCAQNIQTLYNKGDSLYPEAEGLHQYVKCSIDAFFGHEKKEEASGLPKPPTANPEDSKISPIDKDWKKESAISWGWNYDVKWK